MDAVATKPSRTIAISANCAWNLVNFRQSLIRAFLEEGWNVVAVVPTDKFTPALERLGVQVKPFAMDARSISPIGDSILLFRYYQALRNIRPAVFLAFTAKPNVYGSAASAWAGIPSINTISGLGTGFLSGRLLQSIMVKLYRWGLRNSHRIFFHNEDDLNLFVGNRIVRPGQARLVKGSGVNLSEFAPLARTHNHSGAPTFLFIGRLLKDKGVREFIAAAAEVKQNYAATFQIMGAIEDHPKAVPAHLIKAAVENGHIKLLGSTTDVRPFVDSADCIVLPSYREGLPRVVLEAAAMGKPVITTDVPGCRDAVDRGVTGLLCEARSSRSLANAISTFAAMSHQDRAMMGVQARAKAEDEFSEDGVIAAYLESVAEVVVQQQSYECS